MPHCAGRVTDPVWEFVILANSSKVQTGLTKCIGKCPSKAANAVPRGALGLLPAHWLKVGGYCKTCPVQETKTHHKSVQDASLPFL